jgi:hypothetical protein
MENNNSSLFNLREYDLMFNISTNVIVVVIIIMAIVMYLLFFSNLGNTSNLPEGENTNNYVGLLMSILLIAFVILCVKYYYDNVLKIKEKSHATPTQPLQQKEVFNIPENIYNYNQAEQLCKAYDSRLATYEEVEKAYNEGAEWCNYGWSNNQTILFPTQKATYDNLQKIKGHENDCGRQGVNGGYMEDSELKFGVNCFGYKPKIRLKEAELMKNTTPYPKTKEEEEFNENVDKLKNNLDDIIISPFNYKMWTRF